MGELLAVLPKLTIAALVAGVPSMHAKALPDKTLIYCSEGSPAGFDPGQYTGSIENSAGAETIYNRLVDLDLDTNQIQPSLAERWTISKNNRAYTFYLRHGVKFHTTPWFKPTRDFNAEDVLFTFERMRNPKMLFRSAYPTEFPYWHYTHFDESIEKIEALDPYTIRFTLKSANAAFLSYLAAPSASILSAEYAAQLLKKGKAFEINQQPVGTGPFIFREYIKDATIRFEGNTEYWKPSDVRLSKLIFAITPDAATRAQKLKVNECQVSAYPRPDDLAELQAHPNLRVLSQSGFTLSYLAYNVTHQPLDDVRVRRALDMAIDKNAIVKAVYAGHAQIAVAPMPPLQWSYNKALQDVPRDLKKARQLLARAGYPNGLTITLWAPQIQRPNNPNPRLMAEMIQADWAKTGVKAKIASFEWGEYIKRTRHGEHDAMLIGALSDNNDPNTWFTDLNCASSRTGFTKWCNKSFDHLLTQAIQTTDITQRTHLYTRAQQIFKHEQPFTPIAYPIVYQVINKQVTGFKIHLFATVFNGVGLEE